MSSQKICNYHKFGFCRLRTHCPNIHPKDVCENDTCDVQEYDKRHPVPCRLLAQGECRFKQGCMFSHRKPQKLSDLEEKVDRIDKENLNYARIKIVLLKFSNRGFKTWRIILWL